MIYPRRLNKKEIIGKVTKDVPKKITKGFVLDLWRKGLVSLVRDSFEEAVEKLSEGGVTILGERFRVPKEDSDYMLKSLWGRFVKVDSAPNLRKAIDTEEGRTGSKVDLRPSLGRGLAERLRLWPYTLIKEAMARTDIENPPLGFYWVGPDGYARAVSWIRSIDGAILTQTESEIEVGKFYGRNTRVKVRHGDGDYTVDLTGLGLYTEGDVRQYSSWLKFLCSCNCGDMGYRSRLHDKWAQNIYLFCKHCCAGFFKAIEKSRKEKKKGRQIRINPFPLSDTGRLRLLDNAANNTLIMDSSGSLNVPNKTELDQLLGADTVRTGYDNGWFHWQKRFRYE